MAVSNASRAQLHATADGHGFLELLLIEHASWTAPVRVVNDTRDWTIAGNTWIGLPFKIKLPSQAQGENPRAQLQVDNVGRELTAALEALPVGSTLLATITVASRATPAVADYSFVAQLSGISVSTTTVSCTMGPDDTLRQSAVRVRYDPANAPGLFAG